MKQGKKRFAPTAFFISSFFIIMIPMVTYFFYWIPHQEMALNDRYMRVLAMMSQQVENREYNIQHVLKSIPTKNTNNIIYNLDSFKFDIVSDTTNFTDIEYEDIRYYHFSYNYDKSIVILYLEINLLKQQELSPNENVNYWDSLDNIYLTAEISINNFIDNMILPDEFNDILLLSNQLKVLYQSGKKGEDGFSSWLKISQIDSLSGPNGEAGLIADSTKASFNSGIYDISISGKKFKLFLQPINLSNFYQIKSMAICGLIPLDDLSKRYRQISDNVTLLFIVVIILIVIAWPFLKLLLIGPSDRIRSRDILLICFSFSVGLPILIFSTLDTFSYDNLGKELDKDLTQLSKMINKNFKTEVDSAYSQIEYLKKDTSLFYKIDSLVTLDLLSYPYYDMIFEIGSNAKLAKTLSTSGFENEEFDVSNRGYYMELKNGRGWEFQNNEITGKDASNENAAFFIDPVYSKSSGKYEINLSRHLGEDTIAAISFRPPSVLHTLIPPGMGFMIIDESGKVHFHSDSRYNSYENIYSETNNNELLYSSVKNKSTDTFSTEYRGEAHIFHIEPMTDIPWMLITYREKNFQRAINIETLFSASLIYLVYLLIIGLLLILDSIFRHILKLPEKYFWEWPRQELKKTYLFISCFNLLVFLGLFIYVSMINSNSSIWLLLVPTIVLFYNSNGFNSLRSQRQDKSKPWKILSNFKNSEHKILNLITIIITFFILSEIISEIEDVLYILIGLLFLSPLYEYIILKIGAWERENPINKNITIKSHKNKIINIIWAISNNSYAFIGSTLLLLSFIFPAKTIFEFAERNEKLLLAEYGQLEMAKKYSDFKYQYKANYPIAKIKNWENMFSISNKLKKFLPDSLSIYSESFFNTIVINNDTTKHQYQGITTNPTSIDSHTLFLDSLFIPPIYMKTKIVNISNSDYSKKIMKIGNDGTNQTNMEWLYNDSLLLLNYKNNESFANPEVTLLSKIKSENKGTSYMGIFGIIVLDIFWAVIFVFLPNFYLSKNVFFMNYRKQKDPKLNEVIGEKNKRQYILIYGENNAENDDNHVINCHDTNAYKLTEEQYQEGKNILICNFDYKKHDFSENKEKLKFLELIISKHKNNILIHTKYEPINNFNLSSVSADNKQGNSINKNSIPIIEDSIEKRWNEILSKFSSLYNLLSDVEPAKFTFS